MDGAALANGVRRGFHQRASAVQLSSESSAEGSPAPVMSIAFAPGDRLHLHLAGRRLVLERPQDAVDELRGNATLSWLARCALSSADVDYRLVTAAAWP